MSLTLEREKEIRESGPMLTQDEFYDLITEIDRLREKLRVAVEALERFKTVFETERGALIKQGLLRQTKETLLKIKDE